MAYSLLLLLETNLSPASFAHFFNSSTPQNSVAVSSQYEPPRENSKPRSGDILNGKDAKVCSLRDIQTKSKPSNSVAVSSQYKPLQENSKQRSCDILNGKDLVLTGRDKRPGRK